MLRDMSKGTAVFLGSVVVIIALVVGSIYIGGSLQKLTAPFRGGVAVKEQTQGNGSYRIAAYNHFYELCASAQTMQQNIGITKRMLKKATSSSEKQRLQTTLQAQQNQLNDDVNSYNAGAREKYTIGQFKSSDLPYTLDTTQEITCKA